MEKKLPEGWEWKKLGEILLLLKNGISKKQNQDDTGYSVTRIETISDGTINLNKVGHITELADKDIEKYRLIEGDILFSHINSLEHIGKTAIYENHSDLLLHGVNLLLLRPNCEIIVPKYLQYVLRKLRSSNVFRTIANKSVNQASINQSILSEIIIPVPPIETQKKIVAILEKAEETKKLRAQADELMQQLLQNVFLEMFGDPVENPNNFEVAKLKEISEIVSGVTKGRKLAGKTTVFAPYLRVANVQDGYLDLNEVKEIEVLPSDVEKYALQDGDVLLTEGGDPDKLGRGAVWDGQVQTCIHQNHIFRVRVNREYLVPEYLSMLTGSTYGKMYFLKSAKQTTGIASINSTQLKNFPALIAPLDLQLKFAEIVHQIEKTKQSQQQSSQEIDKLFKALMQKAFTGELIL